MARPIRVSVAVLSALCFLVLTFGSRAVCAQCGNQSIGVYSLKQYAWASWYDNGVPTGTAEWKVNVDPQDANADPYYDFYAQMTCTGSCCADSGTSRRYQNQQVIHENIVGATAATNWNGFDMVFFYGHNNSLVPPHPQGEYFGYHQYNSALSRWEWHQTYDLSTLDWGHNTSYDYHKWRVVDANYHPAGVVYLYRPFTSLLLGYSDFKYGVTSVYRTFWNSADQFYYSGGLGGSWATLKWLVLHGCQAVIVANEDGSSANELAHWIYSQAWNGIHMILGHYRSFGTGQLPALTPLANDLKSGQPVQQAYFNRDVAQNSSAITAELESSRTCFYFWGMYLCYIDEANTMMVKDKWTAPQPSVPRNQIGWFYTRWVQNYL